MPIISSLVNYTARSLLQEGWDERPVAGDLVYLFICIILVLFAGCMSGLTLGLMSMDVVDLEVLKRSGSPTEQAHANRIVPVISNAHFLLVTLLLCNALAMEALPLFLDKLVPELVAIVISVTAVLLFGEIIPQAICVRYGLAIGSAMSWPVRCLMWLTSPISWPLGKLLDYVLGGDHATLFRRKQLKALVSIHGQEEGFGGKLSLDEITVITGALDLTTKKAFQAMTPMDKVFMLSDEQTIDDATVQAIMTSKPYSRVPVYRGSNKRDVIGLILIKEMLEYLKHFPDAKVSSMKIRTLPRLSADTPMYDMLKLFRTGRSHMALLVQPEPDDSEMSEISNAPDLRDVTSSMGKTLSREDFMSAQFDDVPLYQDPDPDDPPMDPEKEARQGLLAGKVSSTTMDRAPRLPSIPQGVPVEEVQLAQMEAGSSINNTGHGSNAYSSQATTQGLGGNSNSGRHHHHHHHSSGSPERTNSGHAVIDVVAGDSPKEKEGVLPNEAPGSVVKCGHSLKSGRSFKSKEKGSDKASEKNSNRLKKSITRLFRGSDNGAADESSSDSDSDSSDSRDDDLESFEMPMMAKPGEPVGIITIEDVIEELMQFEIVDETDQYIDNEQSVEVNQLQLERDLPDHLRAVLQLAEAAKKHATAKPLPPQVNLPMAAAAGAPKKVSFLTTALQKVQSAGSSLQPLRSGSKDDLDVREGLVPVGSMPNIQRPMSRELQNNESFRSEVAGRVGPTLRKARKDGGSDVGGQALRASLAIDMIRRSGFGGSLVGSPIQQGMQVGSEPGRVQTLSGISPMAHTGPPGAHFLIGNASPSYGSPRLLGSHLDKE